MLRIRLHGRGGQGMKTASRIVDSASFWEGRNAQDSRIYGAERRGAPMVALTRIDDEPILERGLIASPDIVVVADETLLEDVQASPLQGLGAEGRVLMNSKRPPEALCERYGFANGLAALDDTELALTHVGSMAGLSVALAVATCKLVGLSPAAMEYAVREELAALGLDPSRIEQNVALASIAYERLIVLPPREELARAVTTAGSLPQPTVVTPTYQGVLRGTPSVVASANTPLRKTGNWRMWRPAIELSRCTQYWVCFVSCPDGAIALDDEDQPHIDYDVCKGCLICVEECPTQMIYQRRTIVINDRGKFDKYTELWRDVERAREDIYLAQKDRQLIAKLRDKDQ